MSGHWLVLEQQPPFNLCNRDSCAWNVTCEWLSEWRLTYKRAKVPGRPGGPARLRPGEESIGLKKQDKTKGKEGPRSAAQDSLLDRAVIIVNIYRSIYERIKQASLAGPECLYVGCRLIIDSSMHACIWMVATKLKQEKTGSPFGKDPLSRQRFRTQQRTAPRTPIYT